MYCTMKKVTYICHVQRSMKKKQNKMKQNTYIAPPLGRLIKWWKSKSTPETKGGTFNYSLYLQILEVKNR